MAEWMRKGALHFPLERISVWPPVAIAAAAAAIFAGAAWMGHVRPVANEAAIPWAGAVPLHARLKPTRHAGIEVSLPPDRSPEKLLLRLVSAPDLIREADDVFLVVPVEITHWNATESAYRISPQLRTIGEATLPGTEKDSERLASLDLFRTLYTKLRALGDETGKIRRTKLTATEAANLLALAAIYETADPLNPQTTTFNIGIPLQRFEYDRFYLIVLAASLLVFVASALCAILILRSRGQPEEVVLGSSSLLLRRWRWFGVKEQVFPWSDLSVKETVADGGTLQLTRQEPGSTDRKLEAELPAKSVRDYVRLRAALIARLGITVERWVASPY